MSSNRPLFDDEDLPAWLKNAGITYAGRHSTPSTPGGPSAGESDMSWLDSGPAEANQPWSSAEIFGAAAQQTEEPLPWTSAGPVETPAAPPPGAVPWSGDAGVAAPPPANANLPWTTDTTPEAAPAGESMPWAQGPVTDQAPESAPDAELPWAGGSTANLPAAAVPDVRLPGTGQLPWLEGPTASQPKPASADRAAPPAQEPGKGMTGSLPWKQGAEPAPEQAASEPLPWETVSPAAQPPAAAEDEWLQTIAAPGDETYDPFAETPPQAPQAAGDNWLDSFSLDEETPAQPTGGADESWLNDLEAGDETPKGQPAAEDESWLDEALSAPPTGQPPSPADEPTQVNRPTLLRPVPLQGQPPAPQAEEPLPDVEPDWLSEETSPAEAPAEPAADIPDWFKNIDTGKLTATPTEPAAPAPNAEDLDFETLFGAKETGEPKQPEPAPSTPPAAPPRADEEMLDWMAELPPSVGQAAPTAPAQKPAWPEPPAEPVKPAAPRPEKLDWMEGGETDLVGDIAADWLQEAKPPTPAPAKNEADDMPEWLRGMAPAQPQAASQPAPEADLSLDWLDNIEVPAETPPASPAPAAAVPVPAPTGAPGEDMDLNFDLSSADIDNLLNLPSSGELVAMTEPEQGSESVNLDETINFDELQIPEAGAPAPEAEAPAPPPEPMPAEPAPALPKRLGRKKPLPEPAAAPTPAPAPAGTPGEVLPEWVSEMRPADAPVSLHIGDQEVRVEQTPLSRLNNQLRQLRERIKSAGRPAPTEPTPDSGPLSGIGGALPPASGALKPGGGGTVMGTLVGDLQARRVTLLQNILSIQDEILRRRVEEQDNEPEAVTAAKRAQKTRARSRFKPDRFVVTLVLALVLIAPFFTSALNLVSVPTLNSLPQAQRDRFQSVLQVVDTLQAKQPVLMAFEYGPTASGELDDLAEAVLRDLFRVGAMPVIVSGNPSGAMHAQELVTRLAAEGTTKLAARQDYVILRYLPGGAAGVRALVNALQQPGFQQEAIFSTDIEGKPWAPDAAGLLALRTTPAFVLTETQDDVRNWVEQYRSTLPGETLRMVLLSSASASATAQSYVSYPPPGADTSGQRILGPLVGVRDALIYETARNQFATPDAEKRAEQRWQSISVTALFAAVIILLGAALNMIRNLAQRRVRR